MKNLLQVIPLMPLPNTRQSRLRELREASKKRMEEHVRNQTIAMALINFQESKQAVSHTPGMPQQNK